MRRSRFILLVAFGLAGLALSFLVQRRAEATIQRNETSLRQQREEIARVAAENDHLTYGVAQVNQAAGTNADYTAELAQLRAKAAALRAQQIQLSNQQWSSRLSEGVRLLSAGNSNLIEHTKTIEISMAGGPRPNNGKVSDARSITAALRKYAVEHEGQFPLMLDQVTADLPKPLTNDAPPWADVPVSGTNDFEIVFQGGTNDLGNIPPRRVALLRERRQHID